MTDLDICLEEECGRALELLAGIALVFPSSANDGGLDCKLSREEKSLLGIFM